VEYAATIGNLSKTLLRRCLGWDIEAGFREIKQEIGSAETQTRTPDAVTNHLNFCMAAVKAQNEGASG